MKKVTLVALAALMLSTAAYSCSDDSDCGDGYVCEPVTGSSNPVCVEE